MERTLKIYIYKDGSKPIFHQPILKGLYASEGWFMKLMEQNRLFVVMDPAKAHLFYMPFSSRMLEFSLYVRNSHNRTNLRQYLKDYTDQISAKYRYFNRTGGADHFLVACHDWVCCVLFLLFLFILNSTCMMNHTLYQTSKIVYYDSSRMRNEICISSFLHHVYTSLGWEIKGREKRCWNVFLSSL